VIETTVCNECWSGLLFASHLQLIVGPFAISISREAFLFAMIVGQKVSLFASPCHIVRGRVSDVHFGLATLHDLGGVTAGAKPMNDALSLSCNRRPQHDM